MNKTYRKAVVLVATTLLFGGCMNIRVRVNRGADRVVAGVNVTKLSSPQALELLKSSLRAEIAQLSEFSNTPGHEGCSLLLQLVLNTDQGMLLLAEKDGEVPRGDMSDKELKELAEQLSTLLTSKEVAISGANAGSVNSAAADALREAQIAKCHKWGDAKSPGGSTSYLCPPIAPRDSDSSGLCDKIIRYMAQNVGYQRALLDVMQREPKHWYSSFFRVFFPWNDDN